jgi:hypothetical protein
MNGPALQSNLNSLVKISVLGEVAHPSMPGLPASPYLVTAEGEPVLVPAFGGIVYNVRLGDRALGWAAELIQPGVSIKAAGANANTALGVFACLGNRARVVNGAAAGAVGIVSGKSGRFAEHVICHFDADALEQMAPGDKVQIQAHGVGLQLADFPQVHFKSCSPELLDALNPDVNGAGQLAVPVKGIVPSVLAGAGAGLGSENGALNLQSSDPVLFAESGLAELRFGDVVAVRDWDSRFGHGYMRGWVTVGVVCQGGSLRSGYGPGIAVIMTGRSEQLEPVVAAGANLADLMGLSS